MVKNMAGTDTYRQYIPDLQLSIERGTDAVPKDGKFYVIREDRVLGSFRSLKQAQELFKGIVRETGYKPQPANTVPKSAAQVDVDRYLETKDLYWGDSYKHRGGGGRGGRGGV